VAHRLDAERALRADPALEAFRQHHPRTAHRHCGQAEDMVATGIEAGGFQVQADPFAVRWGLQQPLPFAAAVPAREPAPPEREQAHVARRKLRAMDSRKSLITCRVSRSISRSSRPRPAVSMKLSGAWPASIAASWVRR